MRSLSKARNSSLSSIEPEFIDRPVLRPVQEGGLKWVCRPRMEEEAPTQLLNSKRVDQVLS